MMVGSFGLPDFVLCHSPQPSDLDRLHQWRKDAITDRDEFLVLQKEFAKTQDRETAKFFKGCAAESLKVYRAICIVAGYLSGSDDGDLKLLPFKDWPSELEPHLRHTFARLEL